MNWLVVKLQVAPPPVKLAVMVPVPVGEGPENNVTAGASGVTPTVPDATLVPIALVAVTEHVYGVPLASPGTTIDVAAAPPAR
jgi:hypothetical protein